MFIFFSAINSNLKTEFEILIAAAIDITIGILMYAVPKIFKWLKAKFPKIENKIEEIVDKDLDQDGKIGE